MSLASHVIRQYDELCGRKYRNPARITEAQSPFDGYCVAHGNWSYQSLLLHEVIQVAFAWMKRDRVA